MTNKKLNYHILLSRAGQKYQQLKIAKSIAPDQVDPEIKSDQVKAILYVLVEEINEILGRK